MGKKKYRSQAEWRNLIEQQAQSGLSGKAYCKQHGLCLKSFYRHRKTLRQPTAMVNTNQFVRLMPSADIDSNRAAATGPVELAHRESQLRLPEGIDPLWLAQLMKALA